MNLVPDGEVLGCGHTFKFVDAHLSETISISDKVEANVIKFRTLAEGPIVVSGASGISSLTSGTFQGTLINGQVTNSVVNISNNNYYQTNIESNTSISNIQDIFTLIDKWTDYSREEKDKAKGTLT